MRAVSGLWMGKPIASLAPTRQAQDRQAQNRQAQNRQAQNRQAQAATDGQFSRPSWQWLDSGQRLHLQHGPIDLIIQATGERQEIARAYRQAHACFQTVLTDLVAELEYLRRPLSETSPGPTSPGPTSDTGADTLLAGCVARRMDFAAQQFFMHCQNPGHLQESAFLTPMIAVAGSVADHVLQAMRRGRSLRRAYVNNGGDIALWLADGERFTVGICDNVDTACVSSQVQLQARHKLGGVATSGWRGRSYSLGIADAVTVIAGCAADADAAATLIANAVDLPNSHCIQRQPASTLSPDSDLGNRLVTVAVDHLDEGQVATALERGSLYAESLLSQGLIAAAYISLQGKVVVCTDTTQHHTIGLTPSNIAAGAMHA